MGSLGNKIILSLILSSATVLLRRFINNLIPARFSAKRGGRQSKNESVRGQKTYNSGEEGDKEWEATQ